MDMVASVMASTWFQAGNWMVRNDNAGVSYGNFVWAPIGVWTEAPDWDANPCCGGGLHGQGPQAFGYAQAGTRLVLCEVDPADRACIGADKLKVRRARIVLVDDDVLRCFLGGFPGSFDLRSLEALPEGVSLSAGGWLNLRSLKALPKGVSLSAGESLDLRSLKALPEGVSLSAGEWLDLWSLEALPKEVSLSAGEWLDLRSLKALPKGVSLSAGGSLDLRSLEALPEGALVQAACVFLKV